MFLYRIGNFFYRKNVPIIPKIFNFLIRLVHNSAVFCETEIGSGTKFAYGGIAVVIHRRAIIGNNVIISQCVTIGGRSGIKNLPIIGDHVFIGAGATILGDVTVGDRAIIGAGAVVITDVPYGEIWAGVPAKKVGVV